MPAHKPPSDIEPSDLFLKLMERPAPSDTFAFPRRGTDGESMFSVRVFVLAEKKLEACRLRARRWLTETAKEGADVARMLDEHAIGDRIAKELLAESVHEDRVIFGTDGDRPQYRRLFRNADDVGELTADEISALFGAYTLTQFRFGPTDVTFTDAVAVNEWVGRLAEGARPFVLSLLASHQRDELLLSLSDRVSTVLKLIDGPPEKWEQSLESLRESWQVGTASSSSDAADSSPSPAEAEAEPARIITKEEAMQAALMLRRQSGL